MGNLLNFSMLFITYYPRSSTMSFRKVKRPRGSNFFQKLSSPLICEGWKTIWGSGRCGAKKIQPFGDWYPKWLFGNIVHY